VLGGKPGSKDSGVPGPRIGYMPQVCHTSKNVCYLKILMFSYCMKQDGQCYHSTRDLPEFVQFIL
jgi:hypothetical protein